MELFRILAALTEPPTVDHRRLADLLDLGPLPDPADHTDLFQFQLYPYASVYLGAEGHLGGEARDRIAGFWRALGLTPPKEPDHLTVMLALHAELCERENAADEEGRDRWRQARKAHLWEHLLSWLPIYLARFEELAPPFYRRWASLLDETLSTEAEGLGPQDQLPLHLREAPGVVDPREEGSDAFLDSLLAPARSGFILVRDDLRRAAAGLELASRVGERKYVLKALLSQDAPATLNWLAGEAARRAEQHRRREASLGAIARSWAEHAEATSSLVYELR